MYKPEVWGVWDDIGPYYVAARNRTLAEAAQFLEANFNINGQKPWGIAIPVSPETAVVSVNDCEYGIGPDECTNPECQHEHEALVYEFEVWERDNVDVARDLQCVWTPIGKTNAGRTIYQCSYCLNTTARRPKEGVCWARKMRYYSPFSAENEIEGEEDAQ